jgi:large subunit ribosomal protein L32
MSIRMRHTRGHTNNRRSHHALKNKNIVTDKESGNLRLPHRLDEATGMYRGKLIVAPRAKATKVSTKEKNKTPLAKGQKHVHEHAEAKHANADAKSTQGIFGKIATAGRPKARSGMGGQAGK